MSVSKRVRFEVLKRDGFKCRYCGVSSREAVLQVDHVVPVSCGGDDTYMNLAAACTRCNAGKAGMPLDYVREGDALSLQESRAGHDAASQLAKNFMHLWEETFGNLDGYQVHSVHRFGYSLALDQLAEAVYLTRDKGLDDEGERWRYFCGICWRFIKAGSSAVA